MPISTLTEAITPPYCQEPFDYEQLETVGDAALKILTVLSLYTTHTDDHVGNLVLRKNIHVSNATLASASHTWGIDLFVPSVPLSKIFWRPPSCADSSAAAEGVTALPPEAPLPSLNDGAISVLTAAVTG